MALEILKKSTIVVPSLVPSLRPSIPPHLDGCRGVQVGIGRGVGSDKVSRGVGLRDFSDTHLQKQKKERKKNKRINQCSIS